jgi:hypothetical protein
MLKQFVGFEHYGYEEGRGDGATEWQIEAFS